MVIPARAMNFSLTLLMNSLPWSLMTTSVNPSLIYRHYINFDYNVFFKVIY